MALTSAYQILIVRIHGPLSTPFANVKSMAVAIEETGLDINQPAKSFHRIHHRRSHSFQGATSFSCCIGRFRTRFSNGDVSSDNS
jgi:hypothetical protein